MSTISQQPPTPVPERPRSTGPLLGRETWAGLAIAVMWLAVLFTALFGPDIVSTYEGTSSTTLPSAVPVALFASLATWMVAKYGFGRQSKEPE